MAKRGSGERSKIVLNELDLLILRMIIGRYEKHDPISILDLGERLEINNITLRNHLNKLIKMEFIRKDRMPKTNKYLLIPVDKNIGFFKYMKLLWKSVGEEKEIENENFKKNKVK